jgi:hypothetical protein
LKLEVLRRGIKVLEPFGGFVKNLKNGLGPFLMFCVAGNGQKY